MENNEKKNQEKEGFVTKAVSKVKRGWDRFSTSTGGRWAIRGGKLLLVGLGVYKAYDYGKKSVKPTIVLATPIEEKTEEEPTEPVEQTEGQAAEEEAQ